MKKIFLSSLSRELLGRKITDETKSGSDFCHLNWRLSTGKESKGIFTEKLED